MIRSSSKLAQLNPIFYPKNVKWASDCKEFLSEDNRKRERKISVLHANMDLEDYPPDQSNLLENMYSPFILRSYPSISNARG
jgi:hypothetical protein